MCHRAVRPWSRPRGCDPLTVSEVRDESASKDVESFIKVPVLRTEAGCLLECGQGMSHQFRHGAVFAAAARTIMRDVIALIRLLAFAFNPALLGGSAISDKGYGSKPLLPGAM